MATGSVQLIVNTQQAAQLFDNLDIKKQSNILRAAVRRALKPVLQDAQSNFSGDFQKNTGEGYRSLGVSMYRKNIGGAVGARINGTFNGYYAKFLDTGTRARFRKDGTSTGKINPSLFFNSAAASREGKAGEDLANGVIAALNKAIQGGKI